MECPVTETGSLFTSGIKKHVKDKRMSKTAKLNVSLASKIKTKIINNSSIFKISLKHNNRALAQALSREKENSRRITTEKMLLQKEVEKLNFENTFLRLKLNNLNKKLIEIEALMNNNLITAIEMSTLSEFHQSPFLQPTGKNKRVSEQCKSTRLLFARVPLTSNDDDDDDDDEDKKKMQYDNNIVSQTLPDVPSSVSARQSLSTQYNLELLQLTENNQNVCGLDDSEQISSIDTLPKESYSQSDQSSKSSLMTEMKNSQPISHRKEKRSLSNVTKRKKRASFLESNNPSSDNPCVTDLDQQGISSPELNCNNEINDHTNEISIKIQRNMQCLPDSSEPASEPTVECMHHIQGNDDFQGQNTVYDADMDLTASEVSQIVSVSTGTKNKSNKKSNDCGIKTFRKVKDSSSDKKKERSKRKLKNTSEMNVEEKIENEPEKIPVGLNGNRDSENPNLMFCTEQLTQLDTRKTITLRNDFDQGDKESTEDGEKKKRTHETDKRKEAYSFSQSSDKFQQESKFDMGQGSQASNKNKASRQTFVIHKLEKGHLFLNQKDKETISENLEVTNEFQTAEGNLCDYETQNMLDLKKDVTDTQPAQQNESKINKLRQKVNRKTKIISEVVQIYGDNDKDEHGPEKGNFSIQTHKDKEVISGSLEDASEFQTPAFSTQNNGSPYDYETQTIWGVKKHIHEMQTGCQKESKLGKKLRQKVCRRTEIISEINQIHENDDKNRHDPEKDNLFALIQKGKEIIPENLPDSNEFQVAEPSTRGTRNLCGYETGNISGLEKCVVNMPPAKQNESKVSKRLRDKGSRKTEIILETNQINKFSNNKGVHDSEKGDFFSLTQKDKESISRNSEVTNEFQIADLSTKKNGNLYDYETLNMLNLNQHVTDTQFSQQNDSKTNKVRQKVNRKTEIISEMNQIYQDNDKDMHDQESDTRDLHNFKISESKQRLECQGIISGHCMEISRNEKENCEQISDSSKQVTSHGKELSSKTKDILAQDKNKSIFQLLDSLQTSVSLESGLKHIINETGSDSGNQMEAHKNTILNKKIGNPFVEVIKGESQVKRINKMTSQSKKRKTFIDPSPDSHEVMQVIADPRPRISIESEQGSEGKKLENEKIKPNVYPKVFNSLSQIYSPDIQDSSLNNVHQGSRPLGISSSKNLLLKENIALESSPVFQVSEDTQMTGMKLKVPQRTQKSGGRMLQDLTNTNFVSNNTANSENKSEDLSLERPIRKRKCTPLHFKEPSLRDKMRR